MFVLSRFSKRVGGISRNSLLLTVKLLGQFYDEIAVLRDVLYSFVWGDFGGMALETQHSCKGLDTMGAPGIRWDAPEIRRCV